ncbi:MAG: hypothetical protein HYR85_27435 [Planctomycetes bacterium]|nr:hypothetical protein [Planctomycetota bacterium]MBI3845516.1 hypothetical protein [Planctomycetota bacterium]
MRTLARAVVIEQLRTFLSSLGGDEHPLCEVAAELGIFCRGQRRLSDSELRATFDWIARTRPGVAREQLEDVANRYKLARQEVLEVPSTCDASMIDRDTCLGWDGFSDSDLAHFYEEWLGEEVAIESAPRGS